MKTILLLASLAFSTSMMAQTDVTAEYVKNASFELDDLKTMEAVNNSADGLRGYKTTAPSEWTVTGTGVTSLLVTTDCFTDNNFGKVTTISDGTQAYYLRQGWSAGTTTLNQSIASLPKGKYKLQADVRSAYANSATSSFHLIANDDNATTSFAQGSASYFTTAKWQTYELNFEQEVDGLAEIGIGIDWQSGGSCIMIDNVRLTRLADDYVEPGDPTEDQVKSVTEGIINGDFIDEATMQGDLLQMLANFTTYLKNDFQAAQAPNSKGEPCGCFKSNSTMKNNEDGVRSNADLSMICAFLAKYGKDKVTLPANVTWDDIEQMAMKSLVFAYSTHKANKLKVCADNNYWGSTSASDHVWESSLWAMSVAYSAFFQWDKLSDNQKGYIKALLKAECNYELNRSIPTGYAGDTKAEENGWEADVLAATLGLFPNDELAPKWFARLREFAINSYSHKDDANNNTVIDPEYDNTTVANLYKGQNLYDDYTLQNHNYFHTSYQNVVIQELGEAALALKLFQTSLYGEEKWKTNALMHNNDKVQKEVLNWLALADGELAMPNGNDWSLFLYDQITSYTTNACFLRDADALMLENLAYKMIKARQTTTSDGSWLLRSDIGARRMGVEAHRVMMTYLMHSVASTANLQASDFETFRQQYSAAKHIKSQNIVRAYTKDRFTTFSWAPGISSYTGYIAANSVDKNKIIVPYKQNNTGNFLGFYTVNGKKTNATPVVNGIYQFDGDAWVMNGELNTNESTLNNRFAIYSTPGNAVIYLDYVSALADGTITKEQGGLTAISVDELTKTHRTLYYDDTHKQSDGSQFMTFTSPWVNVDNALGIISHGDKLMGFGDRGNNNSIMTAKLYPSYSTKSRQFHNGEKLDSRNVVYYSNIDATETKQMSDEFISLTDKLPEGWNGALAADPDGTRYLLLSNFMSDKKAEFEMPVTPLGIPVVSQPSFMGKLSVAIEQNNSAVSATRIFVDDSSLSTVLDKDDNNSAYIQNMADCVCDYNVRAITDNGIVEKTIKISDCAKVTISGGDLLVEGATFPTSETEDFTKGYKDITENYVQNGNFEEDETYGTVSTNITSNGATYAKCYTNKVAPISSKWQNLLPVAGWTPNSTLSGGSNFCRMYSMPYSNTMFCVSPSNVGNYAAKTGRSISDETAGDRTLTVLNSWDKGNNAITQKVSLPAGSYRVLLDMKYDCANQTNNDGKKVTTASNTNTSLTGVSYNGTTDYRYPDAPNTWQLMVYDFDLDTDTDVTLSLGYSSSASTGAANNTLLYIDNIRLLQKLTNGISEINTPSTSANNAIFNIAGQRMTAPHKGLYIQNGRIKSKR